VAAWGKLKDMVTVEGVIVGFNEGRGKMQDMAATLEVMLDSGEQVRASGRIDYATRRDMWLNPDKWMGRFVELQHQKDQTRVANKRFRQFLRFRPDLDRKLTRTATYSLEPRPRGRMRTIRYPGRSCRT